MNFIKLYEQYQNLRTASPPVFGKHLAIQCLGHSLGRDSINKIQPRAIRHNTNLVLLGPSGRSMKTTAQEEIMLPLYPQEHKGPSHFSPEGLLTSLSRQPQLICPLGEFSTILGGIRKGNYLENFKEISNELFTCPETYIKQLSSSEYSIEKPYLSLNTTCTVESYKSNIKPEMVHGGFLPRWIHVYAVPDYRRRTALPDGIENVENLIKQIIKKLYNFGKNRQITFKLTDDAYDSYDDICRDLTENDRWQNTQAYVARMNNYIITYADILFISDFIGEHVLPRLTNLKQLMDLTNLTKLTKYISINQVNMINSINLIDSDLIKRAWDLLKPHLEYVDSLIKNIEENDIISKILNVFDTLDTNEIKKSKALQYSHLTGTQFKEGLATLIERQELVINNETHTIKKVSPTQ